MLRFPFLALAVLALSSPAMAQEPAFTALPVLEIPSVPSLGGATVGRTTDDPRAAIQNPALLGLSASATRQATAATPSAQWFGEQNIGVGAASVGVELGRFDVGAALSQGTQSTDARTLSDGSTYDPTDRYRALSLGAATRGPVRMALGATARYVTTTDAPRWTGERFETGTLRGVTMDLGLAASADVAELANLPTVSGLQPALDVTAGYALSHMSGTVRYHGYDKQSLPRTATLGWSAVGGLDKTLGSTPLRVVELEVAAQADHSLVHESGEGTSYDWVVGSLSSADVLLGTGDERTTGRRGVRLELAETLSLSRGRFDGWGYTDAQTRTLEVSTAGLFKMLSAGSATGPLSDLRQLDLRLGRTTIWAGTPEAATRTTLSLVLGR
ncbi:MAG: hypothetical protein Rubg2KO_37450 [Rubricoccaceae bacterium]